MSFGTSEPARPAVLSPVRVTPGSEDEQRPIGDGTLAQQTARTRAMAERTAQHRARRLRRQMRLVPSAGSAPADISGREHDSRRSDRGLVSRLRATDWSFLTSEPYRGTWGMW